MGGGQEQQYYPQAQPEALPSPPYVPESAVGRLLRDTATEFTFGDPNALTEIRTNPTSMKSMAAYANAALAAAAMFGPKPSRAVPTTGVIPSRIEIGNPTIHLADWRNGGFVEKPAVFLRFGDVPDGPSGIYQSGKRVGSEKGVSVVKAWYDPETEKYVVPRIGTEDTEDIGGINRKAYVVSGHELNVLGSDEEPLLRSGSVKIHNEVHPDHIVSAEDPNLTYSGKELDQHETPDWTIP